VTVQQKLTGFESAARKAPFTHRALPRVAVEALPRGNARTRVKLHANDMQVYVHKMAEAVIDVVVAAAAFF